LVTLPPTDERLLDILETAFAKHAGADAKIDRAELQRALGLRSEYLAGRVLACFDHNGDGAISRDEFLAGVRTLLLGTDRDKLFFAFRLHDGDGDGALGHEDMMRMISISLAESEIMARPTQQAETLVRVLFNAADKNRDGKISFEELWELISKRPRLLRKMTRNEAIWIAPNEDVLDWIEARERGPSKGRLARLGENALAKFVVVGLWIAANATVFSLSLFGVIHASARSSHSSVMVGRALGTLLSMNGALLLVPMMRRLMTRLRASFLGRLAPIDDAIDFHKLLGHAMFALAIAHAAVFTLAYAVGHTHSYFWGAAYTQRGATGVALLVVFAVMWVFSLPFIRRSSRFELFYFTHLLYLVWFALAIVHEPHFLFWAGVPLLGFVIEQVLRLRRRGPEARVATSRALRSGVTQLIIDRPKGFTFDPGDYVFLRIPKIAKREWHPFTISSAPERDKLGFHVRSLGNWTGALRRHAEEHPDDPALTAFVDGPYGSPSAHIFGSRYAVLIGAGIGVTPFASVLESVVLDKYGAGKRTEKLKKAHFFWVNRDQYSFEWFRDLLGELERIDDKGLLEVHLCMTGARGGSTAMGLELARDLMHSAGRSDIITGLRTHTHAGAPDWQQALSNIAAMHAPDPVDVYFCGPPGLGKKIARICERLNMSFREERF
jgi:predicted ferric reductase/Ca2+-binding EF-hand superfamily protein